MQDSILRNLKNHVFAIFQKKGEGRAGQGGQHRARAKASQGKGRLQGRQGAGRVQGQGTEGRARLQDFHLRFSSPENLKNHVFAIFQKKGEGRAGQGLGSERLGAGQHRARAKARARAKGRAGCRAGRAQAGCRGRGRKTSKITFLQFLRRKGKGGHRRVWAQSVSGPGPGPREGQAAGQAGRRQGAGAGHRGQGRVARFHFEVCKA